VAGIIFVVGKFPGNESCRINVGSPFCICWFNFAVVVIKQLLKALASCLDHLFIYFFSFTSKVGTYSTECVFPVCFFIMFHVVFILLLDFAVSLL